MQSRTPAIFLRDKLKSEFERERKAFIAESRKILIKYLLEKKTNFMTVFDVTINKTLYCIFSCGQTPERILSVNDAEIFKDLTILNVANELLFCADQWDKDFLKINKYIDDADKYLCSLKDLERNIELLEREIRRPINFSESWPFYKVVKTIHSWLNPLVEKIDKRTNSIITKLYFSLKNAAKPLQEEVSHILQEITNLENEIKNMQPDQYKKGKQAKQETLYSLRQILGNNCLYPFAMDDNIEDLNLLFKKNPYSAFERILKFTEKDPAFIVRKLKEVFDREPLEKLFLFSKITNNLVGAQQFPVELKENYITPIITAL